MQCISFFDFMNPVRGALHLIHFCGFSIKVGTARNLSFFRLQMQLSSCEIPQELHNSYESVPKYEIPVSSYLRQDSDEALLYPRKA